MSTTQANLPYVQVSMTITSQLLTYTIHNANAPRTLIYKWEQQQPELTLYTPLRALAAELR